MEPDIPELLVEKIISLIPFPFIFKARCLSKAWLTRLSSVSSQDDPEKRCLAVSFQKQVAQLSGNWVTLCPVYIGWDSMCAFAYDGLSKRWRSMPSLSFLPDNFLRDSMQIEGALFYGSVWSLSASAVKSLYVGNILTQSWKKLPPRPGVYTYRINYEKLVCNTSLEGYQVILLCEHLGGSSIFQIYYSESESWISRSIMPRMFNSYYLKNAVYLDGTVWVGSADPFIIVALNVESGTFKVFRLSSTIDVPLRSFGLVTCHGNLLMLVKTKLSVPVNHMLVVKIDFQNLQLVQLSAVPLSYHTELCQYRYWEEADEYTKPISDGSSVFVEAFDIKPGDWLSFFWPRIRSVLEFKEQAWSCLPYPTRVNTAPEAEEHECFTMSSHFAPGLNTFMAV